MFTSYSIVVQKDGNYLLFDNIKDPYQQTSLTLEEIPEKQAEFLKTELGNWLKVSEDTWAKERKFANRINY